MQITIDVPDGFEVRVTMVPSLDDTRAEDDIPLYALGERGGLVPVNARAQSICEAASPAASQSENA